MADRPTAKEVSIDLTGFKDSVDKQFAGVDKQINLLVRLVFGLYILLGAIVGGGFLLRSDLGDLKAKVTENGTEITGLRRDMSTTQSHIGTLEKSASDLTSGQAQMLTLQGQITSTLAQINDKLLPALGVQLLALSSDEQQIVRDFFGMPKGLAKEPTKYKIGDVILDATPVPDELTAKVPQLKGYGYAKDPNNGSVLVVSGRRVVAIIAPA